MTTKKSRKSSECVSFKHLLFLSVSVSSFVDLMSLLYNVHQLVKYFSKDWLKE